MYKKIFSLLLVAFILSGCSSFPVSKSAQTKFNYDYKVPNETKNQLWTSARNYLAHAYGDSRSVFSVSDESDGILIGKGITDWTASSYPYLACSSQYNIKFAAKDGKARLQLELLEGVVPGSKCQWSWPSKSGYKEIVSNFNKLGSGLGDALKGQSTTSDFMDF